jgi:hypothetical protein
MMKSDLQFRITGAVIIVLFIVGLLFYEVEISLLLTMKIQFIVITLMVLGKSRIIFQISHSKSEDKVSVSTTKTVLHSIRRQFMRSGNKIH